MKDSILKDNALNRLAQLMAAWHPDSSYRYLDRAKNLALKLDYKRGVADAYKTYGVLLTGENNYVAANYLNNALRIYRELNHKEGECMTLMNIANLMFLDQDTVSANQYLVQSYQAGLKMPKDSALSIIINNLNLHNNDFLSPATTTLLKRGVEIANRYHDERMILYFKMFEAYREWSRGKKKEANQSLIRLLASADSIGNEYVKLSIYLQIGFRAADTLTSIKYLKKGLDEATLYHFSMFKSNFANNLFYYYSYINDNKNAVKYANILFDTKDAQTLELRKNGFSVLNYTKKDQDLKSSLEKTRTRTWLLIVFICLFIVSIALLFFVIRSYRANRGFADIQNKLVEESIKRNQELENWNQFHSMLLSVLAHDLRQPFSSIIMTSDILKLADTALSEEELQMIVLNLNDTALKSIQLLDGLLLWVRSKKENFKYVTQSILLQDNITEANGLYEFDQQSKHVQLLNQIPEKLTINAHKQMLLFINRNLISNATKYSPAGSKIKIFSETRGDEIIVAVKDQGPGMTPDQINRLFKTDGQLRPGNLKGAGVALSVCYDMIQQMQGRLWVEAEPGKGTTFYYSLSRAN